MRLFRTLVIALGLIGLTLSLAPAAETTPPKPRVKLTKWLPLFEAARLQARKEKKIILAYFSGSDWEDYTKKLEKDVLNTDMFRDWAAQNVILFQADFPRDHKLSANTKSQNDQLKQRYSIIKVPTFILMDNSGLPFARAGYDEAKLRDDEGKGEPKAWIKYLEETIKNRPPDEELNKQKNLAECLAYGKKHYLSSVLLINQGRLDRFVQAKDELVKNQQFVRFINRNVAYAEIEWPFDSDNSPEAEAFRLFAADQKIGPAPLQLVVYDMQTRKVKGKILSVDPARVDTIIALIQGWLPRLDYNNGWIEDYRQAQAIAQQQKRYLFLAFTSMDASEFSKKIDEEVFQSDEFKAFAQETGVSPRRFPDGHDPAGGHDDAEQNPGRDVRHSGLSDDDRDEPAGPKDRGFQIHERRPRPLHERIDGSGQKRRGASGATDRG